MSHRVQIFDAWIQEPTQTIGMSYCADLLVHTEDRAAANWLVSPAC